MGALRHALLALVLVLAACGDSTGPRIPSTAGLWNGSANGLTLGLVLTPAENGTVSGSGTISPGAQVFAVTVTGVHAHPHISLTIAVSGFQSINFRGQFEGGDSMVGALNGSGFNDFALTLRRQ